MKSLLNMAGSQKNKLSKLQMSLTSLDGAFKSLEYDASKLEHINLEKLPGQQDLTTCIEAHTEDTQQSLDDLKGCIEEIQESLDAIQPHVHPCGGPGWIQIVNVTYSDPGVSCPGAWTATTYGTEDGCARSAFSANTINPHIFPVNGIMYNQVCGRIDAFAFSTPVAFETGVTDLELNYVDGISLTRGAAGSRGHIWTFAASAVENPTVGDTAQLPPQCPCDGGTLPPGFVGQNYFCESGAGAVDISTVTSFLGADRLWDGMDCTVDVCCTRANPPYFRSYLVSTTAEDIEARLMLSEAGSSNSDILITRIELYVREELN
jgi:hypothetical protein